MASILSNYYEIFKPIGGVPQFNKFYKECFVRYLNILTGKSDYLVSGDDVAKRLVEKLATKRPPYPHKEHKALETIPLILVNPAAYINISCYLDKVVIRLQTNSEWSSVF